MKRKKGKASCSAAHVESAPLGLVTALSWADQGQERQFSSSRSKGRGELDA